VDRDVPPSITVVLGAGGVVGHAFHVGVLSTLAEEFGWDAREAGLIVGTSAGSVVGAGLRAGLGPLDMRRRLAGTPLSAAGERLVGRIEAALAADEGHTENGAGEAGTAEATALAAVARRLRIASPQRVRRAIRAPWSVTPGSLVSAMLPLGRRSTDHLRVPQDALHGDAWPPAALWVVAVDLDVGRRVVFGRAEAPPATVGQAVEASCAIPSYFCPVSIDGSRYVDGAVHSTTNADLATELEPPPELVLVSAPMSAVGRAAVRALPISIRQLARRQVGIEVGALRAAGIDVVTFEPTVEDLAVMAGNTMDPAKASAVCEQVVRSTRAHLADPSLAEQLARLRR
jgi:NTE family protein